ncbi:glycoside hydrolase family 26 protein [Streptomyces sp. NPDC102406]|uniref:glycoside hydrolase family 26 protein n=1 Tax=Streptomyces sp. NPDC102406 TaxID=3366171 RepID=UPI0037F865DD
MVRKRRWTRYGRLPLVAVGAVLAAVTAAGTVSIERADATPRAERIPAAANVPAPPPVDAPQTPAATPPVTAPPSPVPSADPSAVPSADPSPVPVPTASAEAATLPAFGAYLDYGPLGVARMTKLSDWLDGADLRVGHTYLPGDRWSNIEGSPTFLDSWAKWRRDRDDRLFVLNVPMLERNEAHIPDAAVRTLLRQGAAGDFDRHFRVLAERLVALRVPDTVVVLGWEMNGITYTHRCGPDPTAWKAYWKRIVTTMRAVPGQKFRFDFAPTRGLDAVPWTDCYPGDDVVDILGMDAYDQPSGKSFDEQVSEPYGLQRHVDFAAEHKKPISYPEWGLFRNGDNPEYMRRMLAWMDEHKAVYNTLTDYCPHGVWQCRQNPRAAQVYRTVLSGRDRPALPLPVPARPVEPAGPPKCSPVRLGDWAERVLGGRLCLRFHAWERPS